jgi:UDP-N-acetylmuramyl-tripeptide synthetase
MEAYWQAKASLFQWAGLQSVVINIDDVQGSILAASFSARVLDVWTFSCEKAARLQACDLSYAPQGLRFTVMEASECHRVQTRMMGDYNVSNLLGVMAAMRSLGVPLAAIVDSCHRLTPVPGRMECINTPEQPLVAVDYAHTPDALSKALAALRPLAKQRGGALWCVFGCGGDRDTHKRPLMGAMAARHADHIIVTSDNPRSERPDVIHGQILSGIQGHRAVTVQSDRGLAIVQAIAQAAPADVVLIAGKGHEDYQETEGVRLPFSDMDHVHRALNHRAPQAFAGSQT